MFEQASSLIDPNALVIVLLGTMIATYARQGWSDFAIAMPATLALLKSGFDANATRAALAKTVGQIQRVGHLAAKPVDPDDPATRQLVDTFIRSGSVETMLTQARTQRVKREINWATAISVYENAGELAPVFGLVGTLFSITQLMPDLNASASEIVMSSVAGAVLSTLYGVLSANLIFYPLARAIERRGDREETERTMLLEWFASELVDDRTYSSSPISSRPAHANVTPVRGAA